MALLYEHQDVVLFYAHLRHELHTYTHTHTCVFVLSIVCVQADLLIAHGCAHHTLSLTSQHTRAQHNTTTHTHTRTRTRQHRAQQREEEFRVKDDDGEISLKHPHPPTSPVPGDDVQWGYEAPDDQEDDDGGD